MESLLSSHKAASASNTFYHLCLARRDCPILVLKDLASVIHGFILSWLDYSNAIGSGTKLSGHSKLYLVENVAAHLFSNTGYREHIEPVLCSLH